MALDVYKDWLGIPEDQRPPDHYQLLRLVQFEDDPEKVQKNYHKLNAHVRKYSGGQYLDQSQTLLNELAKAMLCLTDAKRKREYDQLLGREFEDELSTSRPGVDQVLLKQGQISESQVQEAQGMCDNLGIDMRDALVQLKAVKADVAARALATSLGLPFVDLTEMIPDDSVLDRVPRAMVKRNSILPLFVDEEDDVLLVACVKPITAEIEDDFRLRFELPIRDVLATPLAINQAIAKYYAPGAREEIATEDQPKQKKQKKKAKSANAAESNNSQTMDGKQLSIILFSWSFVACFLLDGWVIASDQYFDALSIICWLAIPTAVAAYCWTALWPRK